MVTNRNVYFQALNNVEALPVQTYSFSSIIRVIKRYIHKPPLLDSLKLGDIRFVMLA